MIKQVLKVMDHELDGVWVIANQIAIIQTTKTTDAETALDAEEVAVEITNGVFRVCFFIVVFFRYF